MHLVYPEGVFGAEVAFIVAYLLLEKARLRVSSRGNKTEQVLPTAAGLLAALLGIILHVYYLQLQTYVCVPRHPLAHSPPPPPSPLRRLRVDQVVHGIGLAAVVAELLLGVLALLAFLAAPSVY